MRAVDENRHRIRTTTEKNLFADTLNENSSNCNVSMQNES